MFTNFVVTGQGSQDDEERLVKVKGEKEKGKTWQIIDRRPINLSANGTVFNEKKGNNFQ